MLGLLPPPMSSKHSFSEQPNDHLNLIMGLLDAQSLYRFLRVSRRMALSANRNLEAAKVRETQAFEQVLHDFRSFLKTQSFEVDRQLRARQISRNMREVLRRTLVPGITKVQTGNGTRIGSERYGCDLFKDSTSDIHLALIAARCSGSLEVLNIGANYCAPQVRDAGIRSVAMCVNLRELCLGACSFISDAAIQAISRGCHRLSVLDLSYCNLTDVSCIALADGCRELTILSLGCCNQITDRGMEAIARACGKLSELDVTWCIELGHCTALALATGCPNLTVLRAGNCRKLVSESVVAIAQRCPRLSVLDLASCVYITDIALQAIGRGCSRLTFLSVGNCQYVTDIGIRELVMGCPRLEHLCVNGCISLTDASIKLVAARCPRLIKLRMMMIGVTGDSLKLFRRHPRLKELIVYGTGISNAAEAAFNRIRPGVLNVID